MRPTKYCKASPSEKQFYARCQTYRQQFELPEFLWIFYNYSVGGKNYVKFYWNEDRFGTQMSAQEEE